MPLSHPNICRYSVVQEGAPEELKRTIVVIVDIPVDDAHPDFDADAFGEVLAAVMEHSKGDYSIAGVRIVYDEGCAGKR